MWIWDIDTWGKLHCNLILYNFLAKYILLKIKDKNSKYVSCNLHSFIVFLFIMNYNVVKDK